MCDYCSFVSAICGWMGQDLVMADTVSTVNTKVQVQRQPYVPSEITNACRKNAITFCRINGIICA